MMYDINVYRATCTFTGEKGGSEFRTRGTEGKSMFTRLTSYGRSPVYSEQPECDSARGDRGHHVESCCYPAGWKRSPAQWSSLQRRQPVRRVPSLFDSQSMELGTQNGTENETENGTETGTGIKPGTWRFCSFSSPACWRRRKP